VKRTISLRKAILISAACLLAGILLTALIIYAFMGDLARTYIKLAEIDFLVDRYYYGNVDDGVLGDGACAGFVSALGDKYAQYLPAQAAKENFDSLEGSFTGIGVTVCLHPENHTMYVVNVSKDGPAYNAGIRAGDEITSIDGTVIDKQNYVQSVGSLSRQIGDIIKVSFVRDGKANKTEITVNYFELQSVFYRKIGEYGYIQITQFNDSSVNQFKIALDSLTESGVKGLIFDLIDNGGGTVNSASEILDMLLPEGDIISIRYGYGSEEVLHTSDSNEINLPMAVLTNGNTASAAELFAISIRDYNKGILIGQNTYGKGVMQTTYSLDDGSSVKFTVGQFFSKSKTDFSDGGIIPDVMFELNEHERTHYYLLKDQDNPYIKKAVEWFNENE